MQEEAIIKNIGNLRVASINYDKLLKIQQGDNLTSVLDTTILCQDLIHKNSENIKLVTTLSDYLTIMSLSDDIAKGLLTKISVLIRSFIQAKPGAEQQTATIIGQVNAVINKLYMLYGKLCAKHINENDATFELSSLLSQRRALHIQATELQIDYNNQAELMTKLISLIRTQIVTIISTGESYENNKTE